MAEDGKRSFNHFLGADPSFFDWLLDLQEERVHPTPFSFFILMDNLLLAAG